MSATPPTPARRAPRINWREELAPLVVLAVLMLATTVKEPSFASFHNLRNVITRNVPLALIAVGQTMIIIAGQIDLGVGSVMALSAVSCALVLQAGFGVPLAVLTGILVGAGCGLINGLVTTKARMQSFIVTLAMMGLARGLALLISGSRSVGGGDFTLRNAVVRPEFLGLPLPVWIFVGVAVVVGLVLGRTTFGRHLYAAGSNAVGARLSGVRVDLDTIRVFIIGGLLVGLSGVIECGSNVGAQPTMGQLKELDAIAAAVIGGASLSGGQGSVRGTIIGVLVMAVLRNGCNLLNIGNEWEKVVIGPLIVIAVLYDRLVKRQRYEARG